jgi:hypothetical protein
MTTLPSPANPDLLREVHRQYRLEWLGLHGAAHWARVLETGLCLDYPRRPVGTSSSSPSKPEPTARRVRLKLAVNLARTPAKPVAHAERVMDCGGKRSATPRFGRRKARDARAAVRAAESGAALRGSPQSKNTSAGVALARHFRSHPLPRSAGLRTGSEPFC